MPRLKIAIMGHFPIEGSPRGGVQTVISSLRDELSQRPDIDLHLLQHRQGISQGVIQGDGYTMHLFPARPQRLIPNMMRTPGLLAPYLQELAPDVVSTHQFEYALAAFRAGIPTVHTIHGFPGKELRVRRTLFTRAASLLELWQEQQVLRRATDIIAISQHVIELYRSRTQARFHRVNNPVAADFFEPYPAAHPVPGRLLFVGNLTPRKGVEIAIAAIERVRRQFPHAHLHIVGRPADPDYVTQLQKQAAPLGDAVVFRGSPDRAAVRRELAEAQALVLTSYDEHAPVIVAEAMVSGRPVVVTAVGALPDMVRPAETGYVAPAGDAIAVAQGIAHILADPQAAASMGARAATLARAQYHPQAVAEGYLQAMRICMQGA